MANATTYTDEYRLECADYVISSGKPATQVAEGLGVHYKTLQHWVKKRRDQLEGKTDAQAESANIKELRKRDHFVSLGWSSEGEGWMVPESSSTPVYRMYNANGGEHHYTTDAAERDMLAGVGWNYEGIGWYSDDAKHTPLYRDYNPNASSNNHNYTASAAEHEHLVSIGWRDEGIAWYGA